MNEKCSRCGTMEIDLIQDCSHCGHRILEDVLAKQVTQLTEALENSMSSEKDKQKKIDGLRQRNVDLNCNVASLSEKLDHALGRLLKETANNAKKKKEKAEMNSDIKLGNVVKDKISGFQGVATAKTEWLNGCVRWSVSPQELHDGKPIETCAFDVEQLEVVSEESVVEPSPTGGDRTTPTRSFDPSR